MRPGPLGIVLGVLALLTFPAVLHAWTPGTHIFLGEAVLASLHQLPSALADLIRAFPFDFLYGNIAADTSIAKKYAAVGRHCHAWHVGQQIYEEAKTDALRAFGLGYLSHLAADVVAHNFFVPRRLVLTSSTKALGHSYWESRFEMHLGDAFPRTAREVILMDHGESDGHLDRLLSPTIFSVRTNRRIFRGMVHVTDTTSWQRAFQFMAANSRWDLPDEEVEAHMGHAYEAIIETLGEQDARARTYDPSGLDALRQAKWMRREAIQNGGFQDMERVRGAADTSFGLPKLPLTHWGDSEVHRPWRAPADAPATAPLDERGP